MSVENELGVGADSALLREADSRWGKWADAHPPLRVATSVGELRTWLRGVDQARADRALLSLAELAATDGGDDRAAAGALAACLLPGAHTLAHRLHGLTPVIDQVVASELWLQVRTFPWRRLRKVAATILMNTRAGVLRECGAVSQVMRHSVVQGRTIPIDPTVLFAHIESDPQSEDEAEAELQELLQMACADEVISASDRQLLLCLVAAAGREGKLTKGARSGLMGNALNARVAEDLGVSVSTLRRRARRTIGALSQAYAHGVPA